MMMSSAGADGAGVLGAAESSFAAARRLNVLEAYGFCWQCDMMRRFTPEPGVIDFALPAGPQ
jgi:hypothetical protein